MGESSSETLPRKKKFPKKLLKLEAKSRNRTNISRERRLLLHDSKSACGLEVEEKNQERSGGRQSKSGAAGKLGFIHLSYRETGRALLPASPSTRVGYRRICIRAP